MPTKNTITKKAPTKKTATKKEAKHITPELIYDVIHGKYGDADERKGALTAAGFNPSAVTKKINDLQKMAAEIKPFKEKAGDYYGCLLCLLDD